MTHIICHRRLDADRTGLCAIGHGQLALHVDGRPLSGFSELLRLDLHQIRDVVDRAQVVDDSIGDVTSLSPCDGLMEVWGAGVTYQRSLDARVEESVEQAVYSRVYAADRPELFFKAAPWRVVTDGEPVRIRSDSALNVPEPELAVFVNSHAQVVGYTVCNDMSSRTIEGSNPLYLPQAKIYDGSCALAASMRPAWEVPDVQNLAISVEVLRGVETAWAAATTTAAMHRTITDLVGWLFAEYSFPDGVVLATGTGLAPPMDFSLVVGDQITITIDSVGRLSNPVGSAAASGRNLSTS